MRIAQIAPLYESVPPRLYGGTERVVSYLTEALVAQGHDVTLFASGDSLTRAELVPCCDQALRLNRSIRDPLPCHVMQLEQVRQCAADFDVLHFHTDVIHLPLIRSFTVPAVTTLHGRLDLPDLKPLYSLFRDAPLVSISNAQRQPMPPVNWLATVPHGLPLDLLPFSQGGAGGYLAFLGRIAPEKRPDLAIEIAARSGLPLKIAAKVDKADQAYWRDVICPLIERSPRVEFLGEITEEQKASFLGNALALLFPIDWPEPFGLVMVEAMACGTPVIAFRRGSVPEVVDDGLSGFIVDDVDDAVQAVSRAGTLPRSEVRRVFERRFTADRMARSYVRVYDTLGKEGEEAARTRRRAGNRLLYSLRQGTGGSEIMAECSAGMMARGKDGVGSGQFIPFLPPRQRPVTSDRPCDGGNGHQGPASGLGGDPDVVAAQRPRPPRAQNVPGIPKLKQTKVKG